MNSDEGRRSSIRHRADHRAPRPSWYSKIVGRALPTADAPHQTINNVVALAVFASDALSSTGYATQEILIILAAAAAVDGNVFGLSIPIAIAIVVLLAIVTLSYEQTVHAYPKGGGAYIVTRDNLGELPAQVTGAALLTDYVLTVAVSIASAVEHLVSAVPALSEQRVGLCVVLILMVMVINLRGVKESGTIFAIPTYFFVLMMYATVGTGLVRWLTGTLGTVTAPPEMHVVATVGAVTPLLVLRAFSSGTAALTGIEAISDGILAFREPRGHNAGKTLIWMACILGSLFLGITVLAHQIQAVPSEQETVISQLVRTALGGRNLAYIAAMASTTLILVMAANTSFADFPRLSALLAADGYLPRQLAFRGSRLVYSRGIVALALFACLLVFLFDARVTALIPLYAIGVFLSFTLSQGGMSRRWWKIGQLQPGQELHERGSTLRHDPGWRHKMVINGFGAVCTFVVMWVFAITKFMTGAWIILILVPILVGVFAAIHRHYQRLARKLSLERFGEPGFIARHRVLLPVSGMHRGTMAALRYATSLSDDVTAVHVALDPDEGERLKAKWEQWGGGVRMVILDSPYRLLVEPLLRYIDEIVSHRQPHEVITIVVPQFVPSHWWHNVLHTQAAFWLRLALLRQPGVVVTDVPYLVEEPGAPLAAHPEVAGRDYP
ncbi:MAG: APC family permease [Armatimonadetes bacterium]|nr:APC family permease [Armatimonadota bacterium]